MFHVCSDEEDLTKAFSHLIEDDVEEEIIEAKTPGGSNLNIGPAIQKKRKQDQIRDMLNSEFKGRGGRSKRKVKMDIDFEKLKDISPQHLNLGFRRRGAKKKTMFQGILGGLGSQQSNHISISNSPINKQNGNFFPSGFKPPVEEEIAQSPQSESGEEEHIYAVHKVKKNKQKVKLMNQKKLKGIVKKILVDKNTKKKQDVDTEKESKLKDFFGLGGSKKSESKKSSQKKIINPRAGSFGKNKGNIPLINISEPINKNANEMITDGDEAVRPEMKTDVKTNLESSRFMSKVDSKKLSLSQIDEQNSPDISFPERQGSLLLEKFSKNSQKKEVKLLRILDSKPSDVGGGGLRGVKTQGITKKEHKEVSPSPIDEEEEKHNSSTTSNQIQRPQTPAHEISIKIIHDGQSNQNGVNPIGNRNNNKYNIRNNNIINIGNIHITNPNDKGKGGESGKGSKPQSMQSSIGSKKQDSDPKK